MKFIHMADVHFDMIFTSLKGNKDLVKRRRIEQKQAFKESIEYARKEDVDAIFIAGDLFENKFVEDDTIKYIISCFKIVENIPIFIAPGNHDPYINNSPYNNFDWPENVHIFKENVECVEMAGVNVWGVGFQDYTMDSDVVKNIVVDSLKVNILIAHANLDGSSHMYNDVKTADLMNFDYVALGHIHLPKIDDSKIIYPGSLIAGGFDELGKHGFVLGDVSKDGLNVEFVEMDKREFCVKEFDISNFETPMEVVDALDLGNDIYRIVLTGVRRVNIKDLIEILKLSDKFICEVVDNTRLDYDFENIINQNNLKGIFTRNILDILNDEPEKQEEVMNAIELVYKNM